MNKPTIRELEAILAEDGGKRSVMLAPDGSVFTVPNVIREIADERERQVTAEGWTPDHDDQHSGGTMAKAASCYALCAGVGLAITDGAEEHYDFPSAGYMSAAVPRPPWPWTDEWWKPKDPRRDMIRAAALLVAEIERIDRATAAGIQNASDRSATDV